MSRCRPLNQRISILLLLLVLFLALPGGAEARPGEAPAGQAAPPDRQGKASSEAAGVDPAERKALNKLVDDGHFEEAEEGARKLLDRVRSAGALESRDGVLVVQVLVYTLVRGGKANAAETRQLAELSLSLSEKVLGPDDPLTAYCAADLGDVCLASEEFDEAKRLYELGLRIREKAFGPESLEAAKSFHDLGKLCLTRRETVQGKIYLERELGIREKLLGPNDVQLASTLNNLALVAHITGAYDECRRLLERALSIYEKTLGADHPKLTVPLDNLANVLEAMGDFSNALKVHERSLAILEKAYPAGHPEIGMTLYGLAAIHFQLGDFQEATRLDERALAIAEKTSGPESLDAALVLQALGRIREAVHDHAGALQLIERSLKISEKTLGPDSLLVADRLLSIAEVREAMGDNGAAEPLYRRALKIYQEGEKGHSSASFPLLSIGLIRLRAGDFEQAADLLQRSLQIRESTYGAESLYAAECWEGLAQVRWGEGKVPEALDLALAAQANFRRQFQQTASNLAEREALGYEKILDSARNLALTLVAAVPSSSLPPEAPGRTWEEVIRSRALVLDEAARRHRAGVAGEGPEAEALWKSLVSARNLLAEVTVQGPDPEDPESYRGDLDHATEARDRAERALAGKSPVYRRSLHDREITLPDIERRLPPGSALVAYVKYDHLPRPGQVQPAGAIPPTSQGRYLAAVLAPGTKPRFVPLGPARDIEALVGQWRSEINAGSTALGALGRSSEARYREAGSRLRKAIWDPVEPGLRGAKRVFVVPDGAVNLVSFAALPSGGKSYLLEKGPALHLLSAERDLLREGSGPRSPGPGLVVGGPDFDVRPGESGVPGDAGATLAGGKPADSGGTAKAPAFRSAPPACRSFREVRFDPLPASAMEAAEIGTLLGADVREPPGGDRPAVVMSGVDATESRFKQLAPGARILHLATHGFFAQDRCESILDHMGRGAPGIPPLSGETAPATGDNPLLLSGLALAGANRRGDAGPGDEDGILTAEEIASMDLSGVDWAVLSACETGVGKIQPGEGVLGLRRAFQIAGAGSLIMSLWKVEDDSTRKWMRALYEGRLKGLSTVEAVRNASLAILRDRREKGQSTHPFFWGAFLAAGEWR